MVTTRPMAPDDVAAAVGAWRLADVDLRQRLHLPPNVWSAEATARSERRVAHLLGAALAEASTDQEAEVNHMTAAQGWAVAVALAAGLEIHPHGPILVRGDLGPMSLYLPDGALG